jgi:hypothetical protein
MTWTTTGAFGVFLLRMRVFGAPFSLAAVRRTRGPRLVSHDSMRKINDIESSRNRGDNARQPASS